jgi:hypothetical protein
LQTGLLAAFKFGGYVMQLVRPATLQSDPGPDQLHGGDQSGVAVGDLEEQLKENPSAVAIPDIIRNYLVQKALTR